MISIVTALPGLGQNALTDAARNALNSGDKPVYIIVPKQLTLQSELMLIRALEPGGSFRLNVLSPERLCARIFETAGAPETTKVDDRGRVMLARRAINAAKDELKVYARAGHRRGFPARIARQMELFRQAGLTGEGLETLADDETGLTKARLMDIAAVMKRYEALISVGYMDDEAQFSLASEKTSLSAISDNSGLIFYGFDVMPASIHNLMASLARVSNVTAIFSADQEAQSSRAVMDSVIRLKNICKKALVDTETSIYNSPRVGRPAAVEYLSRNIYSASAQPFEGNGEGVRLFVAKDPREETARVAERCRDLAMQGARWNDMMVLCADMSAYSRYLDEAFAACDIPLFTSSSRSASRHALAEALIDALRLIWKGYTSDDALALLRAGLSDVENPDALANYLIKYAPRGKSLTEPFTKGREAEAAEPSRAVLIEPVVKLQKSLRQSDTLRAQLTAIFGYLTDIGGYQKSLKRQNELSAKGLYRLAGEESQVWNRVITTLDTMAELLGDRRLSLEDLTETMIESLDSAVIKPLPQSGDAVYAQGLDQAVTHGAEHIFILGVNDRTYASMDGLLSDSQLNRLSRKAKLYLGPDGSERTLMRRYYVVSALSAAENTIEISYPLSGGDGSAQRPGMLVMELKRLIPSIEPEAIDHVFSAPNEAVRDLGAHLGGDDGVRALATLSEMRTGGVERLLRAFDSAHLSEQLSPDTAKKLYGEISSASVTRLELFARCPFAHFMRYALSPERVEPYALTVRDEGGFYHDAVRSFLSAGMADAQNMDIEVADRRMDEICDVLLDGLERESLLDSAVSRAEKRRLRATARAAAEALVGQLAGSEFAPVELELEFGRADSAAIRLNTQGGECVLEGRVDRIDRWESPDEDFLRVIDYKRGNTALRLCEAYYGLQLQLIVYLAAAMRRRGGEGAGVYYFRIDEGIVKDQSTDPTVIGTKRRSEMKLKGLTIDDIDVINAMSPNPSDVINITVKDGRISRSQQVIEKDDLARLINRVLTVSAGQVDQIRAGGAGVSPMRTTNLDPCAYCDYRGACLFDNALDASRVRRAEDMKNDQVLMRLREEQDDPGTDVPDMQ